MNKQFSISLFTLLSIFLVSCKTMQSGTGLLISDSYDEKKDESVLTIVPYGNIAIPGKWKKTQYDSYTKQHYYESQDSTHVAVAKIPRHKYDFYKKGQTDKEFVLAYAKWEGDYWAEKKRAIVTTVSEKSSDGYVILQMKDTTGHHPETTWLYGVKNDFGYVFYVNSRSWTDEKIQDFLAKLFLNN